MTNFELSRSHSEQQIETKSKSETKSNVSFADKEWELLHLKGSFLSAARFHRISHRVCFSSSIHCVFQVPRRSF
jgi:hypothetical protein